MTGHESPASSSGREWLTAVQRRGTNTRSALAMFDRLEPVRIDEILGAWQGIALRSGHPLDGMLEAFGWAGKDLRDAENAFPLLFSHGRQPPVAIDPHWLPVGLAAHWQLQRIAVLPKLFRIGKFMLATARPTARLRMTEHRSVCTATLIYDRLPIHDVLRRLDDGCLLGLMDSRYFEQPFFFALARDVPGPRDAAR